MTSQGPVIYRQLVLVSLSGVLHFGEPRGIGMAHHAARSEPFVGDIEVSIEHDSDPSRSCA